MEKFMGIDIGGTNVKIAIVDTKGNISEKIKYSTKGREKNQSFDEYLIEVLKVEFEKHQGVEKVGIGIPGTLTKDRSTLMELPNIENVNGLPLKSILEGNFPGKSFRLENDANAAALGELYFSSSKMPDSYIFITLGTGVGGGVVIDREIFTGGDGNGVEIGHMLVHNGKTLEQNIGKAGIMKRAKKLRKKHKESSLNNIKGLEPKGIILEAEYGDKIALEVLHEVALFLAEALVSTIRLLDIKTVVIGGGLATCFDIVEPIITKFLKENLTNYYVKDLEVRKAELGNNAGIVGAASLCFK